MQAQHGLTEEELLALLKPPAEAAHAIPLSAFTGGLGVFETVCRYCLDWLRMSPGEAAQLLKRSESTIRNAHRAARGKGGHLELSGSVSVPLAVFADREKAPLYALTAHLHEEHGMRFAAIARHLERDPRNINSTYRRGR